MNDFETTLAETLEKVPEIELAVVFGSVARGKETHDSDIDIGVLSRSPSPDLLRPVELLMAGQRVAR